MVQPTIDIQTSFRNGQNFNDTDGLIKNAYLAGVNVRPFGDDLLPRFPYKWIDLKIPSGSKDGLSFEKIFRSGNPQALIPYIQGDAAYLIAIINGTWFRINVNTCEVTLIDYRENNAKLSSNFQMVNWNSVESSLTVFDGDLPLIYDSNDIRRADLDLTLVIFDPNANPPQNVEVAAPEATRSCLGAYDNLRWWIVIASNTLAASDILGSTANAPLSFTSSFTDAGEYTGQFPTLSNSPNFENITALGTLISQNPTFTGQLFASTEKRIYTIKSNVPRSEWETTPGFITQILDNTGIAGNLAWENFGYDLLYVDPQGRMNSLFLAQENLQRWSETNISTEVNNYIQAVDNYLYQFTNVNKLGNLALQTSFPYYTQRINQEGQEILSFAFKGFLVLSTENQSGLNQPAKPIWAGLWEGINPIFSCVIGDKMYVLADDNGSNQLYVIEDRRGNDEYRGRERRIRSRVTFGNYKFQDGGVQDKLLKYIDVSLADIETDLDVLFEFKPTPRFDWQFVGCEQFKKDDCLECLKGDIIADRGGYLKNYKFRVPNNDCESDYRFRSADIRLTLEGLWRLRDFRLKADALSENDTLEFNNSDITPNRCCTAINDYDIYRTFDSMKNEDFKEVYKQCCGMCNGN